MADPGGDAGGGDAISVSTVVERPRGADQPTTETLASGPRRGTPAASPAATTGASLLHALRDEEAESARYIIRLGRIGGLALLAPLPWLGGNRIILAVFAAAVVVAIGFGVWLERVFRDPSRYTDRMMMFIVAPVAVAIFSGLFYAGIFSGAAIFPALGIYFFSRRQSLGWAMLIYGAGGLIQLGLASIVLLGVMADPGLFPHADNPTWMLWFGQAVVQTGFLGAFLLGRNSHRATVRSFEQLQRATQLASQREALLLEVRHDLDQVLQIGGPGPYTGRTYGSHKLGMLIGRGGMGEVYEAARVDGDGVAAVKLLHVRALEDPRQVQRFLREVQAASALRSPHVARVIEACEATDPIPYYAMELLYGKDLAHHLRHARELTPEGLCKLLAEVGALVDTAREHGIVHRDLKPTNLFLATQGEREPIWKVLDFGVAALSETSGTLTQGHVIGTPAYMAPEQARGAAVDHRADIYALAAVAYRWLTGRPAFSGKDVPSLLYQVVHTMPERPSALAELPRDVDLALAVGLAKRPHDRFDRAAELAAAMRAALAGDLDPTARRRGAALVESHPWGSADAAAPAAWPA